MQNCLYIDLCFQQHSYFKFNSLWTNAIKNLLSVWMRQKKKKPTTKSVHITLLALLLIQVFVFIILYYSDMFMILSSGKYNVEENTQGEGWRPGREGWKTDLAIYTHTHTLFLVHWTWTSMCIINQGLFIKRDLLIQLFCGPCPTPTSVRWLRSVFCSKFQLPSASVTVKRGRASDIQH